MKYFFIFCIIFFLSVVVYADNDVKLVLCLDGGGIRGALTASFLERLEKELGQPLHSVFDMFSGTSTGGVIAMSIGILQKTAEETSALYNYDNAKQAFSSSWWGSVLNWMGDDIRFSPKYDGKGKQELFQKYFGDLLFHNTSAPKPVIVPVYDIYAQNAIIFRSHDMSGNFSNAKAWQVGDATSAAPTYFPSVEMNADDGEAHYFVDGAVVANDPTSIALAEAIHLFGTRNVRVLSVGTGHRKPMNIGKESQKWGVQWLNHGLIEMLTDQTTQWQSKAILGDRYLRINTMLPEDVSDDMDAVTEENIQALKDLGDEWWELFGNATLQLLDRNSTISTQILDISSN